MEEGGLKFLTNVKKGYDELALLYPDRICVIDGNDSILGIQNKIRYIVEQKYKEFLC